MQDPKRDIQVERAVKCTIYIIPKMQYLYYAHVLGLLFNQTSVPTSLDRGIEIIIHFT